MSEPAIRCDKCGKKFCRSEGNMGVLCSQCECDVRGARVEKVDSTTLGEFDTLTCDNCERVFTRDEIVRSKVAQEFADEVKFKCRCGHQFVLKKAPKKPYECGECDDPHKPDCHPPEWVVETKRHIARVQDHLRCVIALLFDRAKNHDETKLGPEEAPIFMLHTDLLKGMTYGSEEYKECLKQMKPALDHHYAEYAHHPEHYKNGIWGMDLIDILEMFCDWLAATERHDDGDIWRSLEINRKRFLMEPQIVAILGNTVKRLDPLQAAKRPDEGK